MISKKMHIAICDLKVAYNILMRTGRLSVSQCPMVTIELSSVCNLSCPLCPTGTGATKRLNKFIPPDVFDRIESLTRDSAKGYVFGMWGEPLLHPEFFRMLDKVSPKEVWTSTNMNCSGHIASKIAKYKNLNVICAIDTLDPDEYSLYRVGGSYDKVLGNLRILASGECGVYPQFLVDGEDYDEERFIEFAHEFAIPISNVVIKKKRKNFNLGNAEKKKPGTCHSPYQGIFFNCDGYMVPCCNDIREDLHIMNINEMLSMEDVCSSAKAGFVRKALANDKNIFPSCWQCRGEDFWKLRLPLYITYVKNSLLHGTKKTKPQIMPYDE